MNARLLLAVLLAAAAAPARAADKKTTLENASASFDALDDTLTLYFRDALTGAGVSAATVTVAGATSVSDADGKVSFPMPKVDPDAAETTANADFKAPGYVAAQVPLLFRLGMLFESHYSISPLLPPDDLRVVLDWGESPDDLDAHLVKQGAYHVSYRDAHDVANEAVLDHDAQHGLGPETITLKHLDPGATFTFFVHDYSDRGDKDTFKLAQSKAHVSVYAASALQKTFAVPRGKGNHWTVFWFRGGQIVPASVLGGAPQDPPAAP